LDFSPVIILYEGVSLVVQKFGGTSVGNLERIKAVAEIIRKTRAEGHSVVAVVSARAGMTNDLIARAQALCSNPDEREMDVLLSTGEIESSALVVLALQSLGIPAVSRTGASAGILTDPNHTRARIVDISLGDLPKQIEAGKVVVVAGFQGANPDGQVTTLGRGGSDLSAIAIAAALKADLCQIYTDVDGVYTADPRVVPDARKIAEIAYEEMLELASSGSKVMQTRAVMFAQKFNVPFEVLSSFNTNPGTLVKNEVPGMEDVPVNGVAVDKNQVKIGLTEIPDRPGIAAKVFHHLAAAGVVVDMIVQNVGREGRANISFTVTKEDAYRAEKAAQAALAEMGGGKLSAKDEIAKVSVVGVGMRSHSGVASVLFDALADNGINIQMISTSEIKISVAIDPKQADDAARAAHKAFNLGSS
jgi:aspartate kinase